MNSINLLPKSFKQDIAQAKLNRKTLTTLLKSFFWVVAILLIIMVCWAYFSILNNEISQLIRSKEEAISEYKKIEDESIDIVDRLQTISKIKKNLNHWSPLITEVQEVMPSGAYLSSVKISSEKNNRSEITGFAESKSTVASLRTLLEQSEKFEYVDIEKSTTSEDTITNEDMENFVLSFALSEGALDE